MGLTLSSCSGMFAVFVLAMNSSKLERLMGTKEMNYGVDGTTVEDLIAHKKNMPTEHCSAFEYDERLQHTNQDAHGKYARPSRAPHPARTAYAWTHHDYAHHGPAWLAINPRSLVHHATQSFVINMLTLAAAWCVKIFDECGDEMGWTFAGITFCTVFTFQFLTWYNGTTQNLE